MPSRTVHPVRSIGSGRPARRGLTMAELLVALAIVVVLFTLLIVSSRSARNAARIAEAQAQIRLTAAALDRYAADWPRWNGPVFADRGWPHWNPWAAFPIDAALFPPVLYNNVPGFNDAPGRRIDLSNDDVRDSAGNFPGRDDVIRVNECLMAALTSRARGTPYLTETELAQIRTPDTSVSYPLPTPGGAPVARRRMLDPWGNPIRYLWVTRDSVGGPGASAQTSGWLAITSADPNDFPANPTNPVDPFYFDAQGYVLESAGPDGLFGNVWKRNPTAVELEHAADNLVVRP